MNTYIFNDFNQFCSQSLRICVICVICQHNFNLLCNLDINMYLNVQCYGFICSCRSLEQLNLFSALGMDLRI